MFRNIVLALVLLLAPKVMAFGWCADRLGFGTRVRLSSDARVRAAQNAEALRTAAQGLVDRVNAFVGPDFVRPRLLELAFAGGYFLNDVTVLLPHFVAEAPEVLNDAAFIHEYAHLLMKLNLRLLVDRRLGFAEGSCELSARLRAHVRGVHLAQIRAMVKEQEPLRAKYEARQLRVETESEIYDETLVIKGGAFPGLRDFLNDDARVMSRSHPLDELFADFLSVAVLGNPNAISEAIGAPGRRTFDPNVPVPDLSASGRAHDVFEESRRFLGEPLRATTDTPKLVRQVFSVLLGESYSALLNPKTPDRAEQNANLMREVDRALAP